MLRRNRWTGILAAAIPLAIAAAPAHAWKPKTHIYLAEQALRDALDNGKVTIYETDYRTGKIVGVLGEFPVDPRILAALRANPKQYRAGVLGPDAYPDITTGQCLIHPRQAHALDGQAANGTNSWLTHIWSLTYGPMNLYTQGATRAFAVGYLTHAAGDLFAHTFMNHFSGGEFMLQPDPRNALKHLVVEGYIGKRTPLTIDTFGTASTLSAAAAQASFPGSSLPGLGLARLKQQGKVGLAELMRISRELEGAIVTENDVSIDGLETFLAGELTFGRPGSVLYDKLLNVDERKKSLPYVFSTLRNSLQAEVDRYNKLGKIDKAKYSITHPGRITFVEHWIKDIDKGLNQWPKTSHELAKALVYNETGGGVDIKGARAAIDNYVKNYLVYMGPVPDIAVDVLKFMGKIMDALVPDFLKEAIDEMMKDFRNWVVRKATGKTLDEWAEYLANPETHFDPILNNPGGDRPGRTANRVSLADFNRDYLKLSDTGFSEGSTETFEIDKLPPAFNTVQMCKLLLLDKAGVNQLLDTLAAKGIKRPTLPANFENVMLGWHQSLDNDNQWQGLASRDANPRATLIFAQDGGATYQHLFLKQVGEVDWARESPTTPGGATNPPPPGVPTNPTPPPGVPTNPTTPPPTNPTTPPATDSTGNGDGGAPPPAKNGLLPVGDGKFYSLDRFDVRIESVKMGRSNVLECVLSYRNHTRAKLGVTAGGFALVLTDADGVGLRDMGNLYRANGDDPVRIENTIWLEGGETCRIRCLFKIPKGTEALKKLSVEEYGHIRTYDVSGVSLEESQEAKNR